MKHKRFDCVEMKNRIQKKLREEYEARRGEFASYGEFINRTAEESELIQQYWQRISAARPATKPR